MDHGGDSPSHGSPPGQARGSPPGQALGSPPGQALGSPPRLALNSTRLTRAQARWYLLRFGGPLAVVPSLLQPVVVVATAVAIAAIAHNPLPLALPIVWLALPIWLTRDDTLAVSADDEPELHRLVASVAGALSAPMPRQITIDASPNASFRRGRVSRRTELRIGVPLLVTLDGESLAAVTAHELAHGLQSRRRFGVADLNGRLVQTRQVVLAALASGRGWRRPLWARRPLAHFLAATQPLARALETDADLYAMAVVGPDAMAGALRAADRADAALALYHGFVVTPLVAGGARPERVLAGFTRWAHQADDRILDRLAGWHDADPDSELDAHPLDDDRINDDAFNNDAFNNGLDDDGYDDYGFDSAAFERFDDSVDDPADDPAVDVAEDDIALDADVARRRDAQVGKSVAHHPSGHLVGREPVAFHNQRGAERLLARLMLGRHQALPAVSSNDPADDSAALAWRAGATALRLRMLRSGRGRRRVVQLRDAAAALTDASAVPNDSAALINLLVSLSVAFAVELTDRGWIGPLPGTSTLISPADTFDDALELAMQAIEDHDGITPLVDALRAGRPRVVTSTVTSSAAGQPSAPSAPSPFD